ncbi:MAG: hypothetical protein AAFR81_22305 [Chloroflexota bacterium]
MSEKSKRKRTSATLKRPSVYKHMMSWGLVSGYFLAWAFTMLFGRVENTFSVMEMLSSLIIGFPLFALFGAIPGVFMSVLIASGMWHWLDEPPFTLQLGAKIRIFVATFIMMLILLFLPALLAFSFDNTNVAFIFLTPPLIASVAATYAAHRYVVRLRRWAKFAHDNGEKLKRDSEAGSNRQATLTQRRTVIRYS